MMYRRIGTSLLFVLLLAWPVQAQETPDDLQAAIQQRIQKDFELGQCAVKSAQLEWALFTCQARQEKIEMPESSPAPTEKTDDVQLDE